MQGKNSCAFLNTGVLYTSFGDKDNAFGQRLKEGGSEVMVSITDGAVTKFKEVVTQQGSAGDGVRIFLVPGG